jgi:hypothetical protein
MTPTRVLVLALLFATPALALADDRKESQFKAVVTQTSKGFEVAAVAPNNLASSMGVKTGDTIVSFGYSKDTKDSKSVTAKTVTQFADLDPFFEGTKGYYVIEVRRGKAQAPVTIKGTVLDSPFNFTDMTLGSGTGSPLDKKPKAPRLIFFPELDPKDKK